MNATTATEIAAFNALQQSAFIHNPRSPHISADYPKQRYFCTGSESYGTDVGPEKNHREPVMWMTHVRNCVYRHALGDTAKLSLRIGNGVGDSTTCVNMTATELRDLAARLIDAAADIELWPAARLADYDSLCDATKVPA